MIETPRLRLRPQRDGDLPPFAALNADPEVCRGWSAGPLGEADSNAQAIGLRRHIEDHGFGFWAVEVPGVARFIGFAGLKNESS